METVETVAALRACVANWKKANQKTVLIPTMGNLHSGHLSLVNHARQLADKVIVSIFVNPMQFDDSHDLTAYPRTLEVDLEKLTGVQCDLVFIPNAALMYPIGMDSQTSVMVPGNDDILCGLDRLGHFTGVATVVLKLFNMTQTDIAVFGEKDYQQLLLIKKMVTDLDIPVVISGVETFREADGLAMSSRNQYLTEDERQRAAGLYRTLTELREEILSGKHNFIQLQQQAMIRLKNRGFEPDYIEVRRSSDLRLAQKMDTELRILAAARLGSARLIDNIDCNLA